MTKETASNRKKYSPKRWVIERTNSWHNRFRKLFTRYEKKVGQLSWTGTVILLHNYLQKDNFGIGSNYAGPLRRNFVPLSFYTYPVCYIMFIR